MNQLNLFENLPVPESPRVARFMPPIPDTCWEAPWPPPNLAKEHTLALDTETYEPEQFAYGPGWARGKGHIVGFSLATVDRKAWYWPLRHSVQADRNLPPDKVLAWLQDVLRDCKTLIGANLMYDLGWLAEEGVTVPRETQLLDTQYAQALLYEGSPVNLDHLAKIWLNKEKVTSDLYRWLERAYGYAKDPRSNIHRAPPTLCGPYAEADAYLPMELMQTMWLELERTGLVDLFRLECRLIPLLIAMRRAGCRIAVHKVEEMKDALKRDIDQKTRALQKQCGFPLNVNAPTSLKRIFKDELHLLPVTPKTGEPSFAEANLKKLGTDTANKILEIRQLDKTLSTFVEGYLIKSAVKDRIHCELHPLRGDEYGSRYGRFSSSNPNMQNLPDVVRALFIPDEYHVRWRRDDYSQIELRFLMHYALNVEHIIQEYRENPATDYHDFTINLVEQQTGIRLERGFAKRVNFGLVYGMGQKRLTRELKLSEEEGIKLFDAYHMGLPFVRETMQHYTDKAETHKEVRTILGRRARFDLYNSSQDYKSPALPLQQALAEYGFDIKVAHAYKALNRLLQGGAADLMKKGMVDCWESGIFDVTGVPRITVHDELDFSDPGGVDDAFEEMKRVMETAIPLKVPVIMAESKGKNWKECK